jgi:hypothetical protein
MKLLEFGCNSEGTLTALAILLADGNGRGGGDLRCDDDPIVGHWAGDRIVVAGDYADKGTWGASDSENLYTLACSDYRDVSAAVMRVMLQDQCIAKTITTTGSLAMPPFIDTLDAARKLGQFVLEPEATTVVEGPCERRILSAPREDL